MPKQSKKKKKKTIGISLQGNNEKHIISYMFLNLLLLSVRHNVKLGVLQLPYSLPWQRLQLPQQSCS